MAWRLIFRLMSYKPNGQSAGKELNNNFVSLYFCMKQYGPYYLPSNVATASKGSILEPPHERTNNLHYAKTKTQISWSELVLLTHISLVSFLWDTGRTV